MSTAQGQSSIKQLIETAISGCLPNDWNEENFITRTWLKALRDAYGQKPQRWQSGIGFLFDCQKLTGSLEHAHGDIAFLVKITSPDGNSVTGFASLEAKRSYPDKPHDKYHQLNATQLERQAAHSAVHRLLVYSHTEIPPLATQAIVVPAPIAVICAADAATLEKSGMPLSAQVTRYLQGWDLDFSPDRIASILAGNTRFRHLVQAHVGLAKDVSLTLNGLHVSGALYIDLDVPDLNQGLDENPPLIGGFEP
jgi:hypothetical protein